MAVVTLSRQVGSNGDEIARRVCDLLGYSYFDKRLMVEAASEVGLCDHEVVDFSEEHYKVQDFLSRLFGGKPRPVRDLLIREEKHGVVDPLTAREFDEMHCVQLVRRTVLSAYEKGNVVIVGRGGQAILKGRPGVLHVRVIAPQEVRIQRLRAQGIAGIAKIKVTIEQKDRATAEYLKRFFNIEWDDPTLYHLVLNTGALEIDDAVHIIAESVRQLKPAAVA
jgi:cytidylate kinase